MKEYCLVPVSVAKRCKFKPTDVATPHRFPSKQVKKIKKKNHPPPVTCTTAASTATPPSRAPVNPTLDDLIRVAVPPSFREYGLSLLKLLEGKPGISWDDRANLLPSFSGINVCLISYEYSATEKETRKDFQPRSVHYYHRYLAWRNSPPVLSERNTAQRSKLIGGGIRHIWEAY